MNTDQSLGRRTVVGAALLREGRVLAARRTSPPALAGRWELPGGKLEPGETPTEALSRELKEELGITATVASWLDGAVPISDELELRVAVVAAEEEPIPTEHDRIAWLGIDELDDVDWLDSDRPFLPQLRTLLSAR